MLLLAVKYKQTIFLKLVSVFAVVHFKDKFAASWTCCCVYCCDISTVSMRPEMPAETRTRFLDRVATRSKRLATLVSDLLTISRLDDEVSVGPEDAVDVAALQY